MKTLFAFLILLFAVASSAAPACSTNTATCYTKWRGSDSIGGSSCDSDTQCWWQADATGESPLLVTSCESSRSFQFEGTLVADAYTCTGKVFADDCIRYRAANESGTWVDVTLAAATPRLEGAGQSMWMFNVTAGSGSIHFNCGG